MRKLLSIALVLGVGSSAVAGEPVWRECRIQSGRLGSCGKPASGDGVAFHDGAFRECKFTSGRVFSCSRRFSGILAIADDEGVFRECEVRSGRQSTCTKRFSGTLFLIE